MFKQTKRVGDISRGSSLCLTDLLDI